MSDQAPQIPQFVPVFPLPQVVLFPRAVLPLHVFEPRYRALTADALAGAQLIAIALLQPGFEPVYHTLAAPIHDVVGVGQIIAAQELEDGKYNILLRGVSRARIVGEQSGQSYRVAQVEPLGCNGSAPEPRVRELRRQLRASLRNSFECDEEARQRWLELFEAPLELSDLSDLIASGLPVAAELRQCLLTETDYVRRTELLCEHIATLAALERQKRRCGASTQLSDN